MASSGVSSAWMQPVGPGANRPEAGRQGVWSGGADGCEARLEGGWGCCGRWWIVVLSLLVFLSPVERSENAQSLQWCRGLWWGYIAVM